MEVLKTWCVHRAYIYTTQRAFRSNYAAHTWRITGSELFKQRPIRRNNSFPHYYNSHCLKHLHKPNPIRRPPWTIRPTCYQSTCLQAKHSEQVFPSLFQPASGFEININMPINIQDIVCAQLPSAFTSAWIKTWLLCLIQTEEKSGGKAKTMQEPSCAFISWRPEFKLYAHSLISSDLYPGIIIVSV